MLLPATRVRLLHNNSPALSFSVTECHLNLSPGQTLSLPIAWCAQLPEMLELHFLCQDTVQASIFAFDWISLLSPFPFLGVSCILLSARQLGLLFLAALPYEKCRAKAAICSSPRQHGQALAKLPGVLQQEG